MTTSFNFCFQYFFSSAINPIVYAFMSKNFREAFKQIFSMCTCFGGQRRNRMRTDSNSCGLGNGGMYLRNDFAKSGSEPRSSLLIHTKKTSSSSLNRNGTSIRDLQNI